MNAGEVWQWKLGLENLPRNKDNSVTIPTIELDEYLGDDIWRVIDSSMPITKTGEDIYYSYAFLYDKRKLKRKR